MTAERLEALARIAAARREADLLALARAAAARDAVRARIAALDAAGDAARAEAAADIASVAAREAFGRLVARQRAALEADLARGEAAWRDRRDAAIRSFGQSSVLDSLRAGALNAVAAARARRGGLGW